MNLKNKLIFGLLLSLAFGCSDRSAVVLDNPTELEVEVLGPSGQPVPNAEVRIFRNLRDWESLTREVDIQYTDESGVAYFTDLQSVNYYFYAAFESGGELISNQTLDPSLPFIEGANYELADFLTENAITRVSVNAIFSSPLQVTKFEIVEVQLFLESEDQFLKVRPDTAEIAVLNLLDYDSFDDINNQLGQIINDYGSDEFTNKNTLDIGEQYFFYPSSTVEYDINGLDLDPETYDILFFEINQNDFSFYDEALGTVFINQIPADLPETESYAPRIKNAGDFQFGNDYYVVDLIVNWY